MQRQHLHPELEMISGKVDKKGGSERSSREALPPVSVLIVLLLQLLPQRDQLFFHMRKQATQGFHKFWVDSATGFQCNPCLQLQSQQRGTRGYSAPPCHAGPLLGDSTCHVKGR
jgi:hypothetical protein